MAAHVLPLSVPSRLILSRPVDLLPHHHRHRLPYPLCYHTILSFTLRHFIRHFVEDVQFDFAMLFMILLDRTMEAFPNRRSRCQVLTFGVGINSVRRVGGVPECRIRHCSLCTTGGLSSCTEHMRGTTLASLSPIQTKLTQTLLLPSSRSIRQNPLPAPGTHRSRPRKGWSQRWLSRPRLLML